MICDGVLFADVVVGGIIKRKCPCGSILKASVRSSLRPHLESAKHGRWAVANLPALLAADPRIVLAPQPVRVIADPADCSECDICMEDKPKDAFYQCYQCRKGHCGDCNKEIRANANKKERRCPFCRASFGQVNVFQARRTRVISEEDRVRNQARARARQETSARLRASVAAARDRVFLNNSWLDETLILLELAMEWEDRLNV